jgi:hypothetical protein
LDATCELAAPLRPPHKAAPHWRRHIERQEREREARRNTERYRQAQREAELAAEPHKVCPGCHRSLPLSAYSPKGPGKHNTRCRPCHSANVSAAKQAKRAGLSPEELEERRSAERQEYYSRTGRDGQTGLSRAERTAALALRLAERKARASATDADRQAEAVARETERAATAAKALSRRRAKHERKRDALIHRAAQLIALLNGTAPGERINDAEGWDRVTAELRKVWHLSGDKQCTSCAAIVPPEAMLPPGPGNFYEGQCHPCAKASYEANRAALGIAHQGPPTIRLKDGSTITVGTLARRHHERERNRRSKRFGRAWR